MVWIGRLEDRERGRKERCGIGGKGKGVKGKVRDRRGGGRGGNERIGVRYDGERGDE